MKCYQKIIVNFNLFQKIFSFFINNYLAPFKITPLRYNTLASFFPILETLLKRAFWYRQQFLFRFFFYLLNHSKTLSFPWQRGPSPVNTLVEAWLRFCFWPKTHAQASMCELVRYYGKKPILCVLTNCFEQSAYKFKVVFLIDRTILRQEFMMHHAIAIEVNSEQKLDIWPNLTCFFLSWLFWTLPLGWLVSMS